MEFQFGTNWANFSKYCRRRDRTDAGDGRHVRASCSRAPSSARWSGARSGSGRGSISSPRWRWRLGSWLSGYFILVTNAFMQHPVGHVVARRRHAGDRRSAAPTCSIPGRCVQFAHNQMAALVTGAFVVTAVGAFYALRGSHREQARLYLQHGALAGLAAAILVAFPTGDRQAKMVAHYQEPALAAMEGRFETGTDGGDHAHRAAQRQGAPPRQSDQDPRRAQLPRLRHVPQRSAGTGRVPAGAMARPTSSCSTTPFTSWPASARSSSG